jgi:hypothetical protein
MLSTANDNNESKNSLASGRERESHVKAQRNIKYVCKIG